MTPTVSVAMIVALSCHLFLGAILIWSILFPQRRIWPPRRVTWLTQMMVWLPTIAIFAAAALVGLLEWNALDWPVWFRFGLGLPLILSGNIVVWRAAFGIGMDTTSGARSKLKTDGFYRWSRNPQYVADIAILIGWAVLSGSSSVWIVALGGVAVLALAPFAEEPWLEEVYGSPYRRYRDRTPRFLSP